MKAFAAGADVRMLGRIASPAEGEAQSAAFHSLLRRIADSKKPAVCALNGMAVGGGGELAAAFPFRVAREGLPVALMQPEVNLGIIPGGGGTQRLPRIIGLAEASRLLRTAAPVSAARALELGFLHELIPGERLLDRAVELAAASANGQCAPAQIPTGPIPIPDELPEVDIGWRSRAVDRLLLRAVLEGASGSLEAGLRLESRLFGEGCALEDMRIGVRHFLDRGSRGGPAPFVHR